jgi:hypothetical protein
MAKQLSVRVRGLDRSFSAELVASGASAKSSFDAASGDPGVHLLLTGEPAYHARLTAPGPAPAALVAAARKTVVVQFAGRKTSVRRTLTCLSGQKPKDSQQAAPQDLTAGIFGAAPLFLLPDGTLAASADGPAPRDESGLALVVAAARWVSMRRTTSFECLFPASPFHPELSVRSEHLTAAQAEALVDQLESILAAAAPVSDLDAIDAAQMRSAVATVLSHVVATVRKDPTFRAVADRAVARLLLLVSDEDGPGGRPDLRAHVINLLSMRGPALAKPDQKQACRRCSAACGASAPPYAELGRHLAVRPQRRRRVPRRRDQDPRDQVRLHEDRRPRGRPRLAQRVGRRLPGPQGPVHRPRGPGDPGVRPLRLAARREPRDGPAPTSPAS